MGILLEEETIGILLEEETINNIYNNDMKKMYTFVLAMAASMSVAFGTTTFDFSSAIAEGWTVNPTPQGFETSNLSRGMQMAATTTVTLPNVQNVASVIIEGSTNIDNYTMEVKIGTTSFGTNTLSKGNNQTWTYTGAATSGDLTIIVTKATNKSVWIKTITIDGNAVVPTDTTGTDTPQQTELDTAYVYSEPTVVTNSDSVGSNIAYSFISNNVKVTASKGARTGTYFSANADNTMTFTTTRPMKGLVVNGYVKKGFEAEASAGTIVYESSDEEDVTAEEVLAVTDIDSTKVTISCVKQMRCYSVSIYFDENPDVDIEPGGEEEGGYTYEWEPTEAKQLTITFDTLEYQDLSENLGYACSSLYLMNDEYEMELTVFVTGTGDETLIAPGTYAIDSTYAEGTVMASPGGDDYYDYPSYLITDFEYDSEYGQWVYNTTYYLVSGTLEVLAVEGGVQMNIHATSYFGTTVNATYMHAEGEPSDQDALDNTTALPKTTKTISNGMMLIRRNGKTYTVIGNAL